MLSLGIDIARSGLNTSSGQAAVVSRNIANAGNPLASRKIANAVTAPGGGVILETIVRASNAALTRSLQGAMSGAAGQREIAAALDRLDATVNDPELENSPAARIGKLSETLQNFAVRPDDPTLGAAAIDAARNLAGSLNGATETIQSVRRQADSDINASVSNINALLSKFDEINREIVKGSRNLLDVTDQLDARDEIVRKLSEEVGLRTVLRTDNDMALYTDSGLTLFDLTPRRVSFSPSGALTPGMAGNAVYIDGVPVTGSGALMRIESGRISGLAEVRDGYAVGYQRQIDELARGLVEAFGEKDQSLVPTQPDIPGLFTFAGATTVPPSGIIIDGLAGSIEVSANADPDRGGDFRLLRDGSIGDPGNSAYTYNTTGAAAFSGRVHQLIDELMTQRPFDPASGLGSPSSVTSAASASSGWLEGARQKAFTDAEFKTALMERSHDALSRETGINLDEEMTLLLDIERAYQTSSKLMSVIDEMFRTLLNAA